jgi:uncharacterized protein YgiB involved in biofilm formation
MKKRLTLTATLAAALTGCSSTTNEWDDEPYSAVDTAVCTDSNGVVVDDAQCRSSYRGGGGYVGGYRYHYFPPNARLPFYGDSVRDTRFATGSDTARPGAQYYSAPVETHMTRAQAISRGGFGSSGRSFGGGRS